MRFFYRPELLGKGCRVAILIPSHIPIIILKIAINLGMALRLPRKIPSQNLLEEWLKRVRVQNSDLSISRLIAVSDNDLVVLRNYFSEFFGEDFFTIDTKELKLISLKIKNSDWIFQLLANDDYSSLLQVFETAHLLKNTTTSYPSLAKILKSNSNNQAFRNYLFEAVIYELLKINQIRFETKPIVDGREKEGYLWLNNKKILFECKKLYSYQLPGIEFIFSIQQDFFTIWKKAPRSLNGYISVDSNNEEEIRKNKVLFTNAFKEYFDQVKRTGNLQFNKDIIDLNNNKVGTVFFESYSSALFEYYPQLVQKPAVCFKVLPPKSIYLEDELKHLHDTKIIFKFDMSETVSMDYMLSKLGKKRKSQRDMKHLPRIFFFDNEFYRGSEFPLFQSDKTLDEQRIQKYIESKDTDDIVCILFRKYSLKQVPEWTMKVYCKPHLAQYKELLLQWRMLYDMPDFLTTLPKLLK